LELFKNLPKRLAQALLLSLALLFVMASPALAQEPEVDPSGDEKTEFLGPSGGAFRLGPEEGFGLGTAVPDPTALFGPDRTEVVLNGTTRSSTINVSGYYLAKPSENHQVLFEANVDPTFLGGDLSYSWRPRGGDGLLTVNGFLSTARFAPFLEVDPSVELPNFTEPYLQQGGVGLEYTRTLNKRTDLALAINYQNYAFSDELFGGNAYPIDLTGTPLAFGGRSHGDLYTLNFHGVYSSLDDRNLPTSGTKVRLGLEQAFGLGGTSTAYNRLSANVAQFIRVPGFNDREHRLLLNLQAGSIAGTSPQIRSFNLGGPFSVRGYAPGEMASGKAFAQASVEYRHSLTSFKVKESEMELRLAGFFDYASVLGTQYQVRGFPDYLYQKPADGYGYGLGLHLGTKAGLFRLEAAWNDRGSQATYLSVGERF
jgi:outer membrane protein insertion porin family